MYATAVTFDSIESALEFVKTELQTIVDKHNDLELTHEQKVAQAKLLATQETDLRAKCGELSKIITDLESKRETIKVEVRNHAKKTTDRLEKERAEFETTRIKRREELVKTENELNTRQAALDQAKGRLSSRSDELDTREQQLSERELAIETQQAGFTDQLQTIDAAKKTHDDKVAADKVTFDGISEELNQRALIVQSQEADVAKKKTALGVQEEQTERYHAQARKLVLSAENRMTRIEAIDKQLKTREERLNTREATLRELDKVLTSRKIQLDDREQTQNSH